MIDTGEDTAGWAGQRLPVDTVLSGAAGGFGEPTQLKPS